MRQSDWDPLYEDILADMGWSREDDERTVRVLKAVTSGCDLVDPDDLRPLFKGRATVFGDAPCLEDDVARRAPEGTLIAAGSSVRRVLDLGISPEFVVTDLDGDVEAQLEASAAGAVTFVHAHGDNADLVRMHAGRFRGPVVLTTQSRPETTVFDFGGLTDGDRAVCIAEEFGCSGVLLLGFDFGRPNPKPGSDPAAKLRKLAWAERIVSSLGVSVERPRRRWSPLPSFIGAPHRPREGGSWIRPTSRF